MAWTPSSLPDSVVLLGGKGDEANLTAEILPSNTIIYYASSKLGKTCSPFLDAVASLAFQIFTQLLPHILCSSCLFVNECCRGCAIVHALVSECFSRNCMCARGKIKAAGVRGWGGVKKWSSYFLRMVRLHFHSKSMSIPNNFLIKSF